MLKRIILVDLQYWKLFNFVNTIKSFQVFLCNTNNLIKHQLFVWTLLNGYTYDL